MLHTIPRLAIASLAVAIAGCSPRITERKIVGAWSWTYIEGKGRIVYTADHKVKEGFEPEEDPGRPLRDDDFTYLRSGTWRLEGDILVTETDSSPWIAWYDKTFRDDLARGDDYSAKLAARRPKLDQKIERQKVVRIEAERMTFADGYFLERDHRVK